jgi:glutathione peroxidase
MYKLLIFTAALFFQTSIYTLHLKDIDGGDIALSDFKGKKLLLVNIASGSALVNQLADLEQLQETFQDSLVVIAIPSNSFGHESKSREELAQFCKTNYHASFLLAQQVAVTGSDQHELYTWLTNQSQNGVMQNEVTGDFQKFLVDGSGNLIGVFSPKLSPLDQQVKDAITASP